MDFRQLRYFVAVAEELNIGRASVRLHISQPPLTRQMQSLEEQLGVTLFLRGTRGVELTEAGQYFFEGAKNILALGEQTVERAQRASQGQLGRIDIGLFGSSVLSIIPKILLAFRNLYPDVKIVLHTMDKNKQIDALRNHTITIGFNRLIGELPDIKAEVVMNENLMIAINEAHPLAKLAEIPLAELAGHPVVLFPSGSRPNFIDMVIGLCRDDGFQPQVAQEVNDILTGVALVAGGFGFCVVPQAATNLKIPGVAYRTIKKNPQPTVDVSCLYRKDDQSPILQSFLQIVRLFRRPSLDA
jgi:DNA-binding transcriptional LysR family regulator